MDYFADYRAHVGARDGRHFKSTVFRGQRLLVGVNCLEPGQAQEEHTHDDQDKFYIVQEGRGRFSVGDTGFEAKPGAIVWAPAGARHGVVNAGPERLVLFVGMAPPPGSGPVDG